MARGGPRARSHCRSVLTLIHFIPDSLTYSVPLLLKRQCDRTLGAARQPGARPARDPGPDGAADARAGLRGVHGAPPHLRRRRAPADARLPQAFAAFRHGGVRGRPRAHGVRPAAQYLGAGPEGMLAEGRLRVERRGLADPRDGRGGHDHRQRRWRQRRRASRMLSRSWQPSLSAAAVAASCSASSSQRQTSCSWRRWTGPSTRTMPGSLGRVTARSACTWSDAGAGRPIGRRRNRAAG